MKPHLLVAGNIHEAGLRLLETQTDITYDYVPDLIYDSYAPLMPRADGLVVRTQPVRAETIASAPRLKIVSRHGVGYDAVDVEALNKRKIPLAIVGDVNSRAVAEHAIMMLFSLSKKIRIYDQAVRKGQWNLRNQFDSLELFEKTLLIVGLGRIGRHLLGMARGFGMTILAYDPGLSSEMIKQIGAEPVTSLHDGLRRADLISLHAPKSGDQPLIGKAELAIIKSTAILVNTARGGLIDEEALVEALENKKLRGAGLDVFSDEPPVASSALLHRDDVILTPHTASLTDESAMRMAVTSIQNALDCFAGKLNPALVVNRDAIGFGS
ncbi:MAG: 3-phosphoglycerate dehydrogenase [Alphaproteobacteria bacterium]|nr:3-phosphoglycerate dehydrogenase [Alphaproteobacteria bacterium]